MVSSMKGTAYLLQAALISLWWLGLLIYKDFYMAFQFPTIGNAAFNSFMLPDLTIVALLSLFRSHKVNIELEYIILGGFAFATLYCINASILTSGGYLSTVVMILGLSYNLFLIYGKSVFRESNSTSNTLNAVKTLLQIICVWTITLLVIPLIIINSFGTPINSSGISKTIGCSFLAIFSFIGLYSAYYIVKNGKGTPLPLDQTTKLVTEGPYRIVRNPMAIAGIGQGISVSLILGSVHIFIYAIIGALLWHYVVRPIEERDMIHRFGKVYNNYLKEVKCWIPKFGK